MTSSRAAQAIEAVSTDLSAPGRGVDNLGKGTTANTFIKRLWDAPENRNVIEKFLNNRLCRDCAANKNPDACLKWYQTYAVQDYFYLVDYIKFKALRLTTIPQGNFESVAAEAHSIGRLPEDVGTLDERSVAELAYATYLQTNASRDDWFNAHVIMIARAYGWSKIAELYDKESTDRGSKFYKEFILANIDTTDPVGNPECLSADARKLSAFLDQNVAIWSKQNDQREWSSLFRTSLRLEVALFASAFSPYGDVS